MFRRTAAAVFAAITIFAPAAQSATLNAAGYLNQFSIVTAGDLDTNQDNYGRAYVGGDLVTSGGKADFANRTLPDSPYAALTVAGDIVGNGAARVGIRGNTMVVGGSVENGELQFADTRNGDVQVGGTVSSGTLINNRETPTQDGIRVREGLAGEPSFEAMIPKDIVATLSAASSSLSGLEETANATVKNGNRLRFEGLGSGLSVFNLESSAFDGAIGEVEFSLGATETMLINVAGSDFTLMDNILNLQDADGQRIIWNFFEADTLRLQRKVFGSILAPNAHVTNNTAIEGSLFANSAVLGGQVHLQPFSGEIPAFNEPDDSLSAVPIPAALPLLLFGLASLVGLRRWRMAG